MDRIFRGKHVHAFNTNKKFDGTWFEGYLSYENYINPLDDNYCEKLVDSETVGQFIGITDRNDRRIFEGDIVRHYNDSASPECYVLGVIEWSEAFCRWVKRDRNGKCWGVMKDCVYEVVGNVFDNPELIKDFVS